jgi:nucleoside-diphosphate-sugar epimerase
MAAGGQKILITGGCGFFGAWIVKQILDLGHHAIVFDVDLFTKRCVSHITAGAAQQVDRSAR